MTKRYLVIDVETPNHNNDRISAIAIIRLVDGTPANVDYYLVNPEVGFDSRNIKLTGITPEAVAGAQIFPEVWEGIKEDFYSSTIVAHNAPFDISVIESCCKAYGIEFRAPSYIDTVQLARKALPELPHHRLNDVCQALNIDLIHHHADSDCLACARIFNSCLDAGIDPQQYERSYKHSCGVETWLPGYLTETSIITKQLMSLLQSIIADGEITKNEFESLYLFLSVHEDLSDAYPFDELFTAVEQIMADGIVEQEELSDLLQLCASIVDPVACFASKEPVTFVGKQVCLSGEFSHCRKSELETMLEKKGAIVRKSVVKRLDYLFVGSEGNERWVAGNYGTKIRKALELQKAGANVEIVQEPALFEALAKAPDAKAPTPEGASPAKAVEAEIYQEIQATLEEIAKKNFLPDNGIKLIPGNSYSSVFAYGNLVCRICWRKAKYIAIKGVPEQYPSVVTFRHEQKHYGGNFVNILLGDRAEVVQLTPLLEQAMQNALDLIPKEYDCCSRFEKCSAKGACIHPDPEFAKQCGYRKKLAHGIVYGGAE